MIILKPRMIAFYILIVVTIALLSNRITIQSQSASAAGPDATIGQTKH